MNRQLSYERLFILYIPWMLSLLFQRDATLSYMIAWLGSFVIFALTLTGYVSPLPADRSFGSQPMRPLILIQLIFAGYMCCTSIFYYMALLGYNNFEKIPLFFIDTQKLIIAAKCQRLYCLGHAAFITGVLLFMKYPEKKVYFFDESRLTSLLFFFAIITFPLYKIFDRVPGLSQFSNQFSSLSFVTGTLALAFAIPQRKAANTAVCLLLYLSNFYSALTSGYKEPIIISVMVLGIFLYPNYKKQVLIIFIPALILCFVLLPTYASVYRSNAWSGETNTEEATQLALDAVKSDSNYDLAKTNWEFLVGRLSEIQMFTQYVESTPENIGYYGWQLLKQSVIVIVPRIAWPGKPITENLVMERVYKAGVVMRGSNVSAKPAFIVDGYLSGGTFGVFLSLLCYGIVMQLISTKAELLFGGYVLGTAVIFSGLFQIFWRGLSFEFMLNAVFWSYVTMLVIHRLFLSFKILQKA